METKYCTRCQLELSTEEFPYYKGKHIAPCKKCRSAYSTQWAKEHRDRHLENKKRDQQKHYEKRYTKTREWIGKNSEYYKEYRRKWIESNKPTVRKHERTYYYTLRYLVFDAYDNKCAYCGMDDRDVLVIDHVYDNGSEERKRYKSSYSFLKHIRDTNFPKEYQLLCQNCNWKKRLYSLGDIYDIDNNSYNKT